MALIEPEIPQNTGNIGRTCVSTRAELHLVGKLGFVLNDTNLKRAGLDYWQHLTWARHESLEQWQQQIVNPERVFYFSTKATRYHHDVQYQPGDWFVFGKETKGLAPEIINSVPNEQLIKIPQLGPVRSLNLATAVAIALYEGMRQLRVNDQVQY